MKDNSLTNKEIKRIRSRYVERDKRMPCNDWNSNIYHPRHSLGRLFHEHHRTILVEALNCLGIDLEFLRVLDFGCGLGYWLRYMLELGANPDKLIGVDLSESRLLYGKKKNPAIHWLPYDGINLPLQSETLDLVLQVVTFSSISDENLRQKTANELMRVTKTGGYIFWIDHKKDFSDELKGFSKSKVKSYFPFTTIDYLKHVHPRYFRILHKNFAWACPIIYHATKIGCDSWFLALRKTPI